MRSISCGMPASALSELIIAAAEQVARLAGNNGRVGKLYRYGGVTCFRVAGYGFFVRGSVGDLKSRLTHKEFELVLVIS